LRFLQAAASSDEYESYDFWVGIYDNSTSTTSPIANVSQYATNDEEENTVMNEKVPDKNLVSVSPSMFDARVEVRTYSNRSGPIVEAALGRLDSGLSFSQLVFDELDSRGLRQSEHPASIQVYIIGAPTREPAAVDADAAEPPSNDSGMSQEAIMIVGVAGGVVVLIFALITCISCFLADGRSYQREKDGKEEDEAEPGSLIRKCVAACLDRCEQCYDRIVSCQLRPRKLRLAEPPPTETLNAPPAVGRIFRLYGLNQGEYNGLMGIVVGGPSEDGSYMVDVIILDDERERECKSMSLKPDNLRPLVQAAAQEAWPSGKAVAAGSASKARAPARNGSAPGAGDSYRSSRKASGRNPKV
jgi:hypothetical protein